MKNAVKLFLREWKYLLKRPRSLVLMVLVPMSSPREEETMVMVPLQGAY